MFNREGSGARFDRNKDIDGRLRSVNLMRDAVRGHIFGVLVGAWFRPRVYKLYKSSNYRTLGVSSRPDYAASAASLVGSFGMTGGNFFRPSASRNA